MADGLLSGLTNWIDQRKQAAKASIGLLADNPQEWLTQTTARYLPTKAEEQQYRSIQQAGGDITQTPYYQKIFDLAQFQGSIKPLSKTQFQVANEVAQKNAVDMLGLPPNNTAMDRAKALGYTEAGYHITPNEFSQFKAGGNNPTLSGEAVWISPYADVQPAAHNVGRAGKYKEGTQVLPLLVKQDRPMVLDSKDMLDWARLAYAEGSKEFPQYITQQTAKDIKKDYGMINFQGSNIGWGDKANEMIVFDPKNIRSRFAAFDPARINEPDLLAAGIPFGLLGSTQIDLPNKQQKKKNK